jgi:hypothetical protein
MSISRHWSLDRLTIIHLELLKNIIGVLLLMDESPFLQLLVLKSKEEVELFDHGHLEFPSHEFTKILAHFEISRAKDTIINIYLTNEEFFVDYLCE